MFHQGEKLGPYSLVRPLGRGGFGEVWLAERKTSLLTTQVALKLPFDAPPDLAPIPKPVRFLFGENTQSEPDPHRENEALSAKLELIRAEAEVWLRASGHPNIVPVLEAEVYDGQVVIASEYVAGGTLADWLELNEGKAPTQYTAVGMMLGVLNGLDFLLRNQLIHRDLKPANILLQDGIPRLTDFGLSRVFKASVEGTQIAGTPAYMAPESVQGSYSPASDIWAAGVIFYKLLTGSLPFPQQDILQLLTSIANSEPDPLPAHISPILHQIISKSLSKSTSERYAAISEMREDLENMGRKSTGKGGRQDQPESNSQVFAAPSNNLPQQVTSFIGREKELAEIKTLLGKTRLLTLTGSGGCGKTRLSLQAAEEALEGLKDGVWLVELASILDPSLMAQTVANVFGLKEEPGKPILQSLTDFIRAKRLLLILDNCEHLLDSCSRLAEAILHQCAMVSILTSSRQGLGISGETTYRVPSLSLPDPERMHTPESLSQYEAVRLFMERAVAARADFKITNQNAPLLAWICQQLDGIPFAIELAAARGRSMSVEEIHNKLDQRFRLLTGGSRTAPPRQQTLRSMIDWSYELLTEAEKTLLCRLSVLVGGWTLEAAEAICSGSIIEEWEVLDLVTSLVDKSLVGTKDREGSTRYRLLETVRQYALEQMSDNARFLQFESHANYFIGRMVLVQEAKAVEQGLAFSIKLERELDNIIAALDWSWKEGDRVRAASALCLLQDFWYTRGFSGEGRRQFSKALLYRKEYDDFLVASLFSNAGTLSFAQGDYPSSESYHRESLAIFRKTGNVNSIAFALNDLALLASTRNENSLAESILTESIGHFRDEGNQDGIAYTLILLGRNKSEQGDYVNAISVLEEAKEIAIRHDMTDYLAFALESIGYSQNGLSHSSEAKETLESALIIRRKSGHLPGIAATLANLGLTHLYLNERAQALSYWHEAREILREQGNETLIQSFELQFAE